MHSIDRSSLINLIFFTWRTRFLITLQATNFCIYIDVIIGFNQINFNRIEFYRRMAESVQQSLEESLLRTEPSFCIYTDDEFGEKVGNLEVVREKIERAATIGENVEGEFSFAENGMGKIEEDDNEDEEEEKAPSRFKGLKIKTGGGRISPQAKEEGGDAAVLNKWRSHAEYLEVRICES